MSTFSVQGLPSSTSGAAHEKVPTWIGDAQPSAREVRRSYTCRMQRMPSGLGYMPFRLRDQSAH